MRNADFKDAYHYQINSADSKMRTIIRLIQPIQKMRTIIRLIQPIQKMRTIIRLIQPIL